MISQGAKKDMLVANFVSSIIKMFHHQDAKDDENLAKLLNNTHKINKRIYKIFDDLSKNIDEAQTNLYFKSGHPEKLGDWLRDKLKHRVLKVFSRLQKETSLEILAHQILFLNFCDRDKPVTEEFKFLTDVSLYDEIFDLLEQTNAKSRESEAYKDAVMAIEIIKG